MVYSRKDKRKRSKDGRLSRVPLNWTVEQELNSVSYQKSLKKLLIRTTLEIISPAWAVKLNGANGMVHVYELPLTSSLVALKNGEVVKLKIEGI